MRSRDDVEGGYWIDTKRTYCRQIIPKREAVCIRWVPLTSLDLTVVPWKMTSVLPQKRFYGPKSLCTLSASRRVTEHIKSSDKSYCKRNTIQFVEPSRCQVHFYSSSYFTSHHPWEAELTLDKDKGLACDHTAQEVAEQT